MRRVDNPADLDPDRSQTPFQTDGGQLAYHLGCHSDTPTRVSAIAWNTVRDQPGMSVRDQWNAQFGPAATTGGSRCTAIFRGLSGYTRYGSVPPLRSADKQSSEHRGRPVATRGQLYLVKLTLWPAPVAEPNVGLMAETVSTPVGGDRLLTLQNCHPDVLCTGQ